jgi:hypothetical protein
VPEPKYPDSDIPEWDWGDDSKSVETENEPFLLKIVENYNKQKYKSIFTIFS